MVELKEVIDEETGKKRILLQDRLYSIKDNPIGVREKFWIIRRGGNVIQESPLVTDILFKYNRNDVSCEDYGEAIASKIFQKSKVPCVTYYLAENTKLDGTKINGVLCGSYKTNNNQLETSVYDLQTKCTDLKFNSRTGETNKSINTVYGIMRDLHEVIKTDKEGRFFFEHIQNELIKQALMDFILAQTDRHWLNTTFLEFDAKDRHVILKSKCYDNGCISYLKRKRQAIKTITSQVKGDYIGSDRMKQLMSSYCPMFGIKSSTVQIDMDKYQKTGSIEKLKIKEDDHIKDKFIDELSKEILTNPEIAVFYKLMLHSFHYDANSRTIDLGEVFNELSAGGDEIPKEIKDMVTGVMTYQINEIQTVLDKKLGKNRRSETSWER